MQALRRELRVLLDNQAKILLVHSSSGHVHSLNEVLKDPAVMVRLSDTKASNEVKALDAFYSMMNEDPLRAYYGYKHVRRACDVYVAFPSLFFFLPFLSPIIATNQKQRCH